MKVKLSTAFSFLSKFSVALSIAADAGNKIIALYNEE